MTPFVTDENTFRRRCLLFGAAWLAHIHFIADRHLSQGCCIGSPRKVNTAKRNTPKGESLAGLTPPATAKRKSKKLWPLYRLVRQPCCGRKKNFFNDWHENIICIRTFWSRIDIEICSFFSVFFCFCFVVVVSLFFRGLTHVLVSSTCRWQINVK